MLFNDGRVKIEQIYKEATDSSGKADQVRIHAGANGQVNARINGRLHELPIERGAPYQMLIINTHGGDDRVVVDPDINVAVNISAGDGDERVIAGGGNNRLFGGKGNDFIRLGSGNDLAFGEEGDDLMLAGSGNWPGPKSRVLYLSGDEGNDDLYGGDGKSS